jgi:hypothetical protein
MCCLFQQKILLIVTSLHLKLDCEFLEILNESPIQLWQPRNRDDVIASKVHQLCEEVMNIAIRVFLLRILPSTIFLHPELDCDSSEQ